MYIVSLTVASPTGNLWLAFGKYLHSCHVWSRLAHFVQFMLHYFCYGSYTVMQACSYLQVII